ncbi:ribosomal protein L18e/L15P [Zopfochytrium polystomum]|nr:ribosomal protein L18e/L15P [Zopfochytrium polystomum]
MYSEPNHLTGAVFRNLPQVVVSVNALLQFPLEGVRGSYARRDTRAKYKVPMQAVRQLRFPSSCSAFQPLGSAVLSALAPASPALLTARSSFSSLSYRTTSQPHVLRSIVARSPPIRMAHLAIVVKPRVTVHALNVRDNKGAKKKRKVVGRGMGSGLGKTSGRGHKGLLARSAKARPVPGYEGGQTGLLKAIPMLGRRPSKKLFLSRLHLDKLQHWIDRGRLDASKPITIKHLLDSGAIGSVKDGVVLLARGASNFSAKVELELTHASKNAIKIVEENGGKVTCFDYNRVTIKGLLKPERYIGPPLPSLPTDKVKARYFDPAKRGYLADKIHELMEATKPNEWTGRGRINKLSD